MKGGLRLRFPLPVPKSEAWTGVPDSSLPPKKNDQRPVIRGQSHPRTCFLTAGEPLHLQMRKLRPREGKRLSQGSQQVGLSMAVLVP